MQGKNVALFVTGIRYSRGFRIRKVDELHGYREIADDEGRPSSSSSGRTTVSFEASLGSSAILQSVCTQPERLPSMAIRAV